MRKLFWAPLALGAIGTASAAYAADLANLSGQSCGESAAGSGTGTLTATFTGGSCTVASTKVLTPVQHFFCSDPKTQKCD
jgi:hypothetical protein